MAYGLLSVIINPILKKINYKLSKEKMIIQENEKKIYYSSWFPHITSKILVKCIKYELLSIFKVKNIPETISIEVTRKWNKNCKNKYISDPDIEIFKNYINQSKNIGTSVIVITEGDSLLNEDICEIIKYIDKNNSIVNLFTWGLNFSYDLAKKLKKSGLQTLLISLYSINPKEHDDIRKINGSYYKVIRTIKIAKKVGLMVTLATHINKIDCKIKLEKLY